MASRQSFLSLTQNGDKGTQKRITEKKVLAFFSQEILDYISPKGGRSSLALEEFVGGCFAAARSIQNGRPAELFIFLQLGNM